MRKSIITVELPENLKAFVENEAEFLDYGSPGDFLRSLAEEAQSRRDALELRLLENLKTEAIRVPHEVLERGELVSYLEQKLTESR